MATCTIRVLPKVTLSDSKNNRVNKALMLILKQLTGALWRSMGSRRKMLSYMGSRLEENIPCNFLIVSAIRQGIVDDVVDCSHGK
ncbi:hypothetical protein F8388_000627 [Cannabis sativa]|uniref:Uncharacterized protein n=1 Tax=Cannabis sativa TaxID=3483 RepID=A0A7J6GGA9_CANSA|nr:hypothetical protein F8388_000627 [Cannabis sativa]